MLKVAESVFESGQGRFFSTALNCSEPSDDTWSSHDNCHPPYACYSDQKHRKKSLYQLDSVNLTEARVTRGEVHATEELPLSYWLVVIVSIHD